MRDHARNKDFKSFKAGLHANHADDHAKKLYKATRDGMKLNEGEAGYYDFKRFLLSEEFKC